MKIASFDIFDTLLLLSCGNEEQMFRILGYNILGNDVNFMRIYTHQKNGRTNSTYANHNRRNND